MKSSLSTGARHSTADVRSVSTGWLGYQERHSVFGQDINDTGDSGVRPVIVYSITLAAGQSLTIVAKVPNGASTPDWNLVL
jgi:hypothetical protein